MTEILRPMLFAALSSLAIGAKAGHATRLEDLEWVREKVWDPAGPEIKVRDAVAQIHMLCSHEKRTVQDLPSLASKLGRQLGVDKEAVTEWVEAQPFELLDLENFRKDVHSHRRELGEVGGLVDTLQCRPHFKPSWLVAPLVGLAKPKASGGV